MKYFTKDWYKEMATMSCLVYPETIEEWEEFKQMLEEKGIDYLENCKEELEERKQDLLKFLPESFHPYIHDGTLNSTFPSPQLRKKADDWVRETEKKTLKLVREYDNFYNSIKESLPPKVQKIRDLGMHDASVSGFIEFDKIFEMTFNDRNLKFTFTNVQILTIPNRLLGRCWLYNEIYPSDKGFELRVLFDDLSELFLVAENVLIEDCL